MRYETDTNRSGGRGFHSGTPTAEFTDGYGVFGSLSASGLPLERPNDGGPHVKMPQPLSGHGGFDGQRPMTQPVEVFVSEGARFGCVGLPGKQLKRSPPLVRVTWL